MLNHNLVKQVFIEIKEASSAISTSFGYSTWNAKVEVYMIKLNNFSVQLRNYEDNATSTDNLISLNNDLDALVDAGKDLIDGYASSYPMLKSAFASYDRKSREYACSLITELETLRQQQIDVDTSKAELIKLAQESGMSRERKEEIEHQKHQLNVAVSLFSQLKTSVEYLANKDVKAEVPIAHIMRIAKNASSFFKFTDDEFKTPVTNIQQTQPLLNRKRSANYVAWV